MFKLILSLFIFLSLTSFAQQKEIVLGVTAPALKSKQGQFSVKLYTALFKKLGYKLSIKTFPTIRLAERTRSGKIDGELIRMSNYGQGRDYLTKVEESHFKFSLAAYSSKKNLKVENWLDLKGLHVGHRRGVKVVETELVKRKTREMVHSYDDVDQALTLVDTKRVDVYVGVEYFTDEYIKKSDKKIRKLGVLKSDSAHVFLGQSKSHLAEKLSKELKKMKLSGEYKRIMLSK
jgi:ABC-type amino acid transport substrate-binding protein